MRIRRDVPVLERARRRPWATAFGLAALLLVVQVALLAPDRPTAGELPILAPAWQEVAIIPVAYLLTALALRVALAAAERVARRSRRGDRHQPAAGA